MMAWLKLLDPKVWIYLAIALAVALYTGAVYHAGGVGPRADLATLRASVKAAHDAQVKEDARRRLAQQTLIKEKDNERTQALADADRTWDAYVTSLLAAGSGAGKAKKPVRVVVERCDNPAGNEAVSAAISEFDAGVRARVRQFGAEVARQLKEAQINTDQLVRVQDELAKARAINQ